MREKPFYFIFISNVLTLTHQRSTFAQLTMGTVEVTGSWRMKCYSAYYSSLPPRASHSLPTCISHSTTALRHPLPSYYTYLLSVPLTFTLSNHSHCSQFPSEQLHITHPITRVLVITGPLAYVKVLDHAEMVVSV